jgi:HK97 family phage prohead protease
MKREYRSVELRASSKNGRAIEGYAAVFNSRSEVLFGSFVEVIRPGAFRKSLKSDRDVCALVDHEPRLVLGRKSAGTLELREDGKGLWFRIPSVPNTSYGNDLLESLKRGDACACSFGFECPPGGDYWRDETDADGWPVRELLEVNVFDVSVVTYPAYPGTSVGLRRKGPGPGWYRRRLRLALSKV